MLQHDKLVRKKTDSAMLQILSACMICNNNPTIFGNFFDYQLLIYYILRKKKGKLPRDQQAARYVGFYFFITLSNIKK